MLVPTDGKSMNLMSIKDVSTKVGISRATIYRWMDEGKFPKALSLGTRCARWIESEVADWLNAKKAAR